MLRYIVPALLFSTVAAAQESPTYVFRNVQVLSMETEGVLGNRTVVVTDGRIAAIGPVGAVTAPSDAVAIEAEGRYLIPGLTEMHGHVPGVEDQQYLEDVLFLYVANGVTTVRGMQGRTGHLELRARIARREVLGPRFITSGPALNGDRVNGPEEARRLVLEQARAGYDFIKLLRGLTRAEFDAASQAAAEAGIHLAGHVSVDVGVGYALQAGQATIDHLDGYAQYLVSPEVDPSAADPGFYGVNLLDLIDEDRIAQAARDTREAGVWIVPTQTMIANVALPSPSARELAARPQMAYLPPALVQNWVASKERRIGTINRRPGDGQRLVELRQRIIKALHDEGARLLLGSDAPQTFNVPGYSLHRELQALVDSGLSPYEALRTGTAAPAEFFGAEDEFGRIRVGLAADLVLLAGNPLADVGATAHLLGVMVRGRWLDRGSLDEGLAAIADRRR